MSPVLDMIEMLPFLKQTGRLLRKLLMENHVFFNVLLQHLGAPQLAVPMLLSPRSTLPEIVSKCHAEIFHASLKQNRSAADLESKNKITADQVSSDKWFQYRHGVIASFAHDVLLKVDDNLQISNISFSQNLCAKLCMYNPPIHSAALNWGKTNEKFAFKRHIRKNRTKHKNFSCKTTGLFIIEHYPFLGASPDGVLSCKYCGLGVLE